MCNGKAYIKYNDNSHKVFYNLKSGELECLGNEDAELKGFLKYLQTSKPTEDFSKEIEQAFLEAKYYNRWRIEYMEREKVKTLQK